jgi:hypothetical protein
VFSLLLGQCGRTVGCNFDVAKRSFNRAANSILGKLGVRGHEDVLVQLINAKCMPILLYGTETCVIMCNVNRL